MKCVQCLIYDSAEYRFTYYSETCLGRPPVLKEYIFLYHQKSPVFRDHVLMIEQGGLSRQVLLYYIEHIESIPTLMGGWCMSVWPRGGGVGWGEWWVGWTASMYLYGVRWGGFGLTTLTTTLAGTPIQAKHGPYRLLLRNLLAGLVWLLKQQYHYSPVTWRQFQGRFSVWDGRVY